MLSCLKGIPAKTDRFDTFPHPGRVREYNFIPVSGDRSTTGVCRTPRSRYFTGIPFNGESPVEPIDLKLSPILPLESRWNGLYVIPDCFRWRSKSLSRALSGDPFRHPPMARSTAGNITEINLFILFLNRTPGVMVASLRAYHGRRCCLNITCQPLPSPCTCTRASSEGGSLVVGKAKDYPRTLSSRTCRGLEGSRANTSPV